MTTRKMTLDCSPMFSSAKHRHSMLQLAFSWLLTHPAVPSVIAGAMTPEQVQANARSYVGRLSDMEMAEIDEILSQSD